MGREILICWAGRRRAAEVEALSGRYRRRIRRWVALAERPVRARGGGGDPGRLEAEGEALLRSLPDAAWCVALDRRGRQMSSPEFARWLGRRLESWPHPLAFVVGSDLGLSKKVTEGARTRLSLGPMTLPHELARLVLYEQIYRALSIRAGIKYHREPL